MATIQKYETSSGKTLFEVRYRTPDHRSTRKRGFETLRAAKAFAATTESAKLKGEFVSVSAGRTTVAELGPAWLERQRGHLKPSSHERYRQAWVNHVEPRWGSVRVAGIRKTDVAAWAASQTGGSSTVQLMHAVLLQILDDAVIDGLLVANPARGVKMPKRTPQRNVYLTAAQLSMLADECGEYRSLILLMGVGGLRWGEAIALRPCDINFLKRRIEVHRNAVNVAREFVVGTPKSGKSRTVVVPEFVIDALARTAEGKGHEDLMWAGKRSGTYLMTPGAPKNWLPRAIRRCQTTDPSFPRVTPHMLRHTAASLAISAGANVKVVQRMMGHASAAMTLDVYTDLFECDLDAVAESVAKLWPREA